MRNLFTTTAIVLTITLSLSKLSAQRRYLDPVFNSVKVTQNVVYGNNISIITGQPAPQDLIMDIYEPEGDAEANRPVILVSPTGNFLPPIVNGAPTGSIRDSANVYLCRELAKLGYVAVSFFYRLGWNPLSTVAEVRKSTILQAAYRGVHDARTCVRFFRKSFVEDGNPYRIDTSRIIVGGIGTGGYVSAGAAFLDDYAEIQDAGNGKFIDFTQTPPVPYVLEARDGDVFGVKAAPLNTPNYPTYSSRFIMGFNLGGACGDSIWIDKGEVPYISFHTPQDPNAPYMVGNVIVPTTGDIVIDNAAGSYTVAKIQNRFGNNDIFKQAAFSDNFTKAANKNNDGFEGLFPFDIPTPPAGTTFPCGPLNLPRTAEGSPWSWWNEAVFIATWDAAVNNPAQPGFAVNCSNKAGQPDRTPAQSKAYLDTVVQYLAPRMFVVMANYPTARENALLKTSLKVYPNPAQGDIQIQQNDLSNVIESVQLVDQVGKTIRTYRNIGKTEFVVPRENLSTGFYLLRIKAKSGELTEKILIQ